MVGGGSRFPTAALAVAGGILLIAGLIVYLIFQSGGGSSVSASQKAAQNRSTDIPGTYVEDQGISHFSGFAGHQMTPFCEGVAQSDSAKLPIVGGGGSPIPETPTSTPIPSSTPSANTTSTAAGTPNTTPTIPSDCYLSNPPTSGKHIGVLRGVDVGGGNIINIPPDPDVYPDDVEIPRDAIAHIQEHSGVFVGWNCKSGDTACTDAAQKLKDLVNSRIDNHDDRVVMAHDNDLPEGTFGLASWTRVLNVPASDWDNQKSLIEKFISVNACRFDPEGFCN
jgi:hypothetical protein